MTHARWLSLPAALSAGALILIGSQSHDAPPPPIPVPIEAPARVAVPDPAPHITGTVNQQALEMLCQAGDNFDGKSPCR